MAFDINTSAIMEAVDVLADKKLPAVIQYSKTVTIQLNGQDWAIREAKGIRTPQEMFRKSACSLMMAIVVHVMKRVGSLPPEYMRAVDNG